jgi:hypothetical protein
MRVDFSVELDFWVQIFRIYANVDGVRLTGTLEPMYTIVHVEYCPCTLEPDSSVEYWGCVEPKFLAGFRSRSDWTEVSALRKGYGSKNDSKDLLAQTLAAQ